MIRRNKSKLIILILELFDIVRLKHPKNPNIFLDIELDKERRELNSMKEEVKFLTSDKETPEAFNGIVRMFATEYLSANKAKLSFQYLLQFNIPLTYQTFAYLIGACVINKHGIRILEYLNEICFIYQDFHPQFIYALVFTFAQDGTDYGKNVAKHFAPLLKQKRVTREEFKKYYQSYIQEFETVKQD